MFQVNESSFTDTGVFEDSQFETLKVILTIYNALVIVTGLAGNFLVLLGSVKFNALDLDKTSVFILRHIALADLLGIILRYIPIFITLRAGEWVLGPFRCATFLIWLSPTGGKLFFMCLLSCYILYYCRSSGGSIKSKVVKWGLVAVWGYCVLGTVIWTVAADGDVAYAPNELGCRVEMEVLYHVLTLHETLAIIVTVLANLVVLCFVKNVGAKAVKTTRIVCWIFIVSYVPPVLAEVLSYMVNTSYLRIFRVTRFTVALNMVLFPVVYAFTNKKFAFFLKKLSTCGLTDVIHFNQEWDRSQNAMSNTPTGDEDVKTVVVHPIPEAGEVRGPLTSDTDIPDM